MASYFSLLPPLSRFTNLLAPLKFRGGFRKTRLQETQVSLHCHPGFVM